MLPFLVTPCLVVAVQPCMERIPIKKKKKKKKKLGSYCKEIKQWPQTKAVDADAYRRLQNSLVKCENIDHLQIWSVLNTPDIICMLLSKLPGSVRDKWSRKVLTIQRRGNRESEMADFIHFVNDETLIL